MKNKDGGQKLKMAARLNKAESECKPICRTHLCYSNKIRWKSQEKIFFTIFRIMHISIFFFNFKNSPKIQIASFLVSEHTPYRGPSGVVFCELTTDLLKNCRRRYTLKKLFATLHPDQLMAKSQFAFQS